MSTTYFAHLCGREKVCHQLFILPLVVHIGAKDSMHWIFPLDVYLHSLYSYCLTLIHISSSSLIFPSVNASVGLGSHLFLIDVS